MNFTISKAVENKSEFFSSCLVSSGLASDAMTDLWGMYCLTDTSHFCTSSIPNISTYQYIWHLQILALYIRPIFNSLFYYFIQYDVSNTNISLILFCKYDVYVPIEISLLWSHCLVNCCLMFFLLELTWLNSFLGAKVTSDLSFENNVPGNTKTKVDHCRSALQLYEHTSSALLTLQEKKTDKNEEIKKKGS